MVYTRALFSEAQLLMRSQTEDDPTGTAIGLPKGGMGGGAAEAPDIVEGIGRYRLIMLSRRNENGGLPESTKEVGFYYRN